MEIIGIAGPPCSGKDTGAEYLTRRHGFKKVSTGDLLRERARQTNLDLGRTSLQLLGSRLRAENDGKDPLLQQALHRVTTDTVFTGIRTAGAGEAILRAERGSLLYIESSLGKRYARSVARNRGDHSSFEEFLAQDEIEHFGGVDIDISLLALRAMASKVIANNGSPEEYFQQLDAFVKSCRYS